MEAYSTTRLPGTFLSQRETKPFYQPQAASHHRYLQADSSEMRPPWGRDSSSHFIAASRDREEAASGLRDFPSLPRRFSRQIRRERQSRKEHDLRLWGSLFHFLLWVISLRTFLRKTAAASLPSRYGAEVQVVDITPSVAFKRWDSQLLSAPSCSLSAMPYVCW